MKRRSRRLPPLNSVRAFEAAARHKSITRAADELLVTHGAVSKQVRVLENYLGVQLFERSSSGLALTAAGVELAASLSSIFLDLHRAFSAYTTPTKKEYTCRRFHRSRRSFLCRGFAHFRRTILTSVFRSTRLTGSLILSESLWILPFGTVPATGQMFPLSRLEAERFLPCVPLRLLK
jgi:hypothetical protein